MPGYPGIGSGTTLNFTSGAAAAGAAVASSARAVTAVMINDLRNSSPFPLNAQSVVAGATPAGTPRRG